MNLLPHRLCRHTFQYFDILMPGFPRTRALSLSLFLTHTHTLSLTLSSHTYKHSERVQIIIIICRNVISSAWIGLKHTNSCLRFIVVNEQLFLVNFSFVISVRFSNANRSNVVEILNGTQHNYCVGGDLFIVNATTTTTSLFFIETFSNWTFYVPFYVRGVDIFDNMLTNQVRTHSIWLKKNQRKKNHFFNEVLVNVKISVCSFVVVQNQWSVWTNL